jgi:hypothetical protein
MQFSIRDVLFVTVIVALAFGWFIDRSRRVVPSTPPSPVEYQVIATGSDGGKLLLVDPQTGAVWERLSYGKWSPHTDALKR